MVFVIMVNVLRNFWSDLTNRKLILVKIINACITGATLSLFPYLTIHLRSLGVTVSEIAIMYALLPLMSVLGPPLFGFITDRFGHLKAIFSVSLVASALVVNCLLLVPGTNESPNYPVSYNSSLKFKTGAATIDTGDLVNCKPVQEFNASILSCECSCDHTSAADCTESKLWSLCEKDALEINVTMFASDTNAIYTSIFFPDGEYYVYDCPLCSVTCGVTVSPKELCKSSPVEKFGLTFWLYFLVRFLSNLMIGVTNTLNEAVCLIVINANDGDYGLLRLWGAVGGAAFAPLSGFLIDIMSAGRDRTYYHAAFYIYGGLKILMAIVALFVPMKKRLPSKKAAKGAKYLLKDIRIIVFLIVMFFSGCLWGYLENYLFLFLEELGALKSLMGLTITVGNLAGLPFYIVSGPVIQYFGHINVICFGLFCYGVRFIGYSLIHDPSWCMPYEVLEIFTMSLFMVAAITYACKLAPPIVLATMQGLMAAMYYTIGKGTGSLIGGLLLDTYGHRKTFQMMAGFSLFLAIFYCFLHHTYLKHKTSSLMEEFENGEIPEETSPVTPPSSSTKRYGVDSKSQEENNTPSVERTKL